MSRRLLSGDKTTSIHIRGIAVALTIAFGLVSAACLTQHSAKGENGSGAISSSQRMPDRKQWTTENLNVDTSL